MASAPSTPIIEGMLGRVLEISEENRYLSMSRGFVVIQQGADVLGKVPITDVAVLLLSAQSVVVSKNILNALSDEGCMTVLCGKNYVPNSMVLPTCGNCFSAKVLKEQIDVSVPVKKRIWQQIVMRKIENQALALAFCGKKGAGERISKIADSVKSGDSDNREAYAARMYWKALFGEDFRRDRYGGGVNSLLNYGYAVMRAAMARAICASGLMPSLGIHHDNNLNQFCLADDLFELYRPITDCIVYLLQKNGKNEVTPEAKRVLAQGLQIKLHTSQGDSPAFLSMQYLASSYVHALEIRKPKIDLPIWEGAYESFAELE